MKYKKVSFDDVRSGLTKGWYVIDEKDFEGAKIYSFKDGHYVNLLTDPKEIEIFGDFTYRFIDSEGENRSTTRDGFKIACGIRKVFKAVIK